MYNWAQKTMVIGGSRISQPQRGGGQPNIQANFAEKWRCKTEWEKRFTKNRSPASTLHKSHILWPQEYNL